MAKMIPKNPYPQLGLAGAGFAVLLVILAIPEPSEKAIRAVEWVAIGIPFAIASAYVVYLRRLIEGSHTIKSLLFLVEAIFGLVGDIGCLGGLYWAIRLISPNAAGNFLAVSITAYLLLAAGEIYLRVRYAPSNAKEILQNAAASQEITNGLRELTPEMSPTKAVERTDTVLTPGPAVSAPALGVARRIV